MHWPITRRLQWVSFFTVASALGHAQFVAISDDFSAPGPLVGTTPDSGVGTWTTLGGTPALTVSGGNVVIAASGGEAAQVNFRTGTGDFTTGTFYYGFNFAVSAAGTISTSNSVQAIAGFRTGTAASGSYAAGFGVFALLEQPQPTAQYPPQAPQK